MENSNYSSVFTYIEKLGRVFIWRRRYLADMVGAILLKAQDFHKELQFAFEQKEQELVEQQQSYETLEINYKHKLLQLVETQKSLVVLTDSYNFLKDNYRKKQQVLADMQNSLQDLTSNHHNLEVRYEKDKSEYQKLCDDFKRLQEKNKLVSKLLSIRPPSNQGLITFRKLVEVDYMKLSIDVPFVAEGDIFLKLKSIEQELDLLSGFPTIYTKNIIGIAGGFSAGKSAFINTFIRDKSIQLAVGIQPITAIPTYVVSSSSNVIKGYSINGGCIDLEIGLYQSMTHDYIKEIGFDLKKVMPFMSIGVDLESELFKDICLIDTPGYNPGNAIGFTEGDKNTALHYARQSDALIWVIGLDSNGTISTSDIEFIHQIESKEKPIYFVLNKAGSRSEGDIEDIIIEISKILDEEQINYVGMSAYCSLSGEERTYRKQSLKEFIHSMNHSTPIHEQINNRIYDIFNIYVKAILEKIQNDEKVRKELRSIRLDILESGNNVLFSRMQEKLSRMTPKSEVTKLQENLEQVEELRSKFVKSVLLTIEQI